MLTNSKCMATKCEKKSPRQRHQKLVNGLASAPNVQVVKNSEVRVSNSTGTLFGTCIV